MKVRCFYIARNLDIAKSYTIKTCEPFTNGYAMTNLH